MSRPEFVADIDQIARILSIWSGIATAADIIVERDVAVPMTDGTILRANVFRPAGGGPFPVLVMRTPYGTFLASWGGHGSEPGEFLIPHGVAVDSEGFLHVVDASNQRVQKFDVR